MLMMLLLRAQPRGSHTSAWIDHGGEHESCASTGGLARGEALRHSTALGSLNYITSVTAYSPWYSLAKVTETRSLNKRNTALFMHDFSS